MQLVEIDVVGAEAPETRVARAADILRLAAAIRVAALVAELRGDDDALATRAQSTAEVLLAAALSVQLSRIEEIDPHSQRRVNDPGGGLGVEAPPEVVA